MFLWRHALPMNTLRLLLSILPVLLASVACSHRKAFSSASSPDLKLSLNLNTSQHLGIINGGNNCYIIALLQVLFHLPTFLFRILTRPYTNLVQLTLATLFARLQQGKGPQDMSVDFLRAVKLTMRETKKSGGIDLEEMDDAHAFWTWLMETSLPWLDEELFKLQYETFFEYKGVSFSQKLSTDYGATVKVFENPHTPIHTSLAGFSEHVEFNIEPEEFSGVYDYDCSHYDSTVSLAAKFRELGILEAQKVNVLKHFRIVAGPPILMIQAWSDTQKRRSGDKYVAKYEKKFSLAGRNYRLHAIIFHRPAHFVCEVCVDPVQDLWYNFNDSKVSRDLKPPSANNLPYLFFYVAEDLLDEFSSNSQLQNPEIPEITLAISRIFQSMLDVRNMVASLTEKAN